MSTTKTVEEVQNFLLELNYQDKDVIEILKYQFEEHIASTRRMQKINSLGELLKTLKKRDVITISSLQKIAASLPSHIYLAYKQFQCSNLPNLNTPQSAPNFSLNCVQHYNHAVITRDTTPSPQEHLTRCHGRDGNFNKVQMINEIICSNMGPKHWKMMARYLGLKEAHIDTLCKQYDTAECIREVLEHHETNCDPKTWRKSLLKALEDAKRMDVRQMVEAKLDEYKIIDPK